MWDGSRVVSTEWLVRATSPHVAATDTAVSPPFQYGYWWWLDPVRGGVFAWGHGGQYIWIDRARRLVVVITAAPDAADHGASIEGGDLVSLVDAITTNAR